MWLLIHHVLNPWVDFDLSYVNHREGSVVAHFWIVMSVPDSHVGRVTLEKVFGSLQRGLRWCRASWEEDVVSCDEYLFHLPSLSVSGESRRGNVCILYVWVEK